MGGGGGPTFGKNSQKIPYFFPEAFPNAIVCLVEGTLKKYLNDSLSDVALLVAVPDEIMDFPQRSVSFFGEK